MANKTNDNGVNRDMTADEEAVYLVYQQKSQAQTEAKAEAQAERQTARQAVLTRLGITEAEAKLLLG